MNCIIYCFWLEIQFVQLLHWLLLAEIWAVSLELWVVVSSEWKTGWAGSSSCGVWFFISCSPSLFVTLPHFFILPSSIFLRLLVKEANFYNCACFLSFADQSITSFQFLPLSFYSPPPRTRAKGQNRRGRGGKETKFLPFTLFDPWIYFIAVCRLPLLLLWLPKGMAIIVSHSCIVLQNGQQWFAVHSLDSFIIQGYVPYSNGYKVMSIFMTWQCNRGRGNTCMSLNLGDAFMILQNYVNAIPWNVMDENLEFVVVASVH